MHVLKYPLYAAFLLLWGGPGAAAQDQVSSARPEKNKVTLFPYLLPSVLITEQMEYSFRAGSSFKSVETSTASRNILTLDHEARYRSSIALHTCWYFNSEIYHALGFRYFYDSLNQVSVDENKLEQRVEYSLTNGIRIHLAFELRSRLLNDYLYQNSDSNGLIRIKSAAFLNPLFITANTGFTYIRKGLGRFSLGLSGVKFTWIRDRSIADALMTDSFFGIPAGKRCKLEYGIEMQVLLSKKVLKIIQWDFDLRLFKNLCEPWDMTLQNLVDIRLNRFLKLSLRTRLVYEADILRRLQIENSLSAGFYCSN